MRNFQDIIFIWTRAYREIFKSALTFKSAFSTYPFKKQAFRLSERCFFFVCSIFKLDVIFKDFL